MELFLQKGGSSRSLITTPTTEWRYEYQLPGDRLGKSTRRVHYQLCWALGHTKSGKSLATS
jgi:hypothetical protein